MQQLFLLITSILFLQSCASIPQNTHSEFHRIEVSAGPEDLLLDSISCHKSRLLISCNDHRLGEAAPDGAIYAIDLDQNSLSSYILPRIGEPQGLSFHPHGFDLIRQGDKVYLFVVSHDEKEAKHYVYKYEVTEQHLSFVTSYNNPLMNSPNTVVALSEGGFYVSIDQKKRGDNLALFFSAKTGSIVYCNEQGGWARAATKLAYPNGLYISPKERYLYASTTRQHQIFKYAIKEDKNLINREKIVKLAGGDNIRLGQEQELLIPAHPQIFKFVGHLKDSTKFSPSIVYSLNIQDGKKSVLYSNDGQQISAASTAIRYKGQLFIAQVFQPFILRVNL